jgi:hypothetical protein
MNDEAKVPVSRADVSAVIVRACKACGGAREASGDCVSCGLAEPPEIIDLGIIAAKRPGLEAAWWNVIGTRRADMRIRKANKAIEE